MPKRKAAKAPVSNFITIRIPRDLYQEAIELAPHFRDDVKGITASGVVSKATALRLVIANGIRATKAKGKKAA